MSRGDVNLDVCHPDEKENFTVKSYETLEKIDLLSQNFQIPAQMVEW